MNRLIVRLAWRLLVRASGGWGICGNRIWHVFEQVNPEWTIVVIRFWRNGMEDRYSREEVLQMLRLVRRNEWAMNWKCPEPTTDEIVDPKPSRGVYASI